MRKWTTMLMCGLAVSYATAAWAVDDLEEDSVDYEEAIEYAELMDFFVDENEVEWEVYYDELQGLSWEQRADLGDDEVLEALEQGGNVKGQDGGTILSTLMSPHFIRFWFYEWDSRLQDCKQTTDDWYSYSFTSGGLCTSPPLNSRCVRYTTFGTTPMRCVYRHYSVARSGSSNYCDDDFYGRYWNVPGTQWYQCQESNDWCYWGTGGWNYKIDEDTPAGTKYWTYDPDPVVEFVYDDGGTLRTMQIHYDYVE